MGVSWTGGEGVAESKRGRREAEETAGEAAANRTRKTETGHRCHDTDLMLSVWVTYMC